MPEPVGCEDVALNIRGRPPHLPTIYKAKHHPQREGGSVFYYIQDVSPSGMEEAFAIENSMKIPHGPESLARNLGEYFLNVHEKLLLS